MLDSNQTAHPVPMSMAEVLRRHVTGLTTVPSEGLSLWLPNLTAPTQWLAAPVKLASSPAARVLIRPADDGVDGWIGCDVINLFRFGGTVPADVIEFGAGSTLRALGVEHPLAYRVTMPVELGVTAIRSRSSVQLDARLWVQVTNYVVTNGSGSGSGLIEHTVLIQAKARERLRSDVAQSSKSIEASHATSILGGAGVAETRGSRAVVPTPSSKP